MTGRKALTALTLLALTGLLLLESPASPGLRSVSAGPSSPVRPLRDVSPSMLVGDWSKGGLQLPGEKGIGIQIAFGSTQPANPTLTSTVLGMSDGLYNDWIGGYSRDRSGTFVLRFVRKPEPAEMNPKDPLWAREAVQAKDPILWSIRLTTFYGPRGVLALEGFFYQGSITSRVTKNFQTGQLVQEATNDPGPGPGKPVEYIKQIGCDLPTAELPADMSNGAAKSLSGAAWKLGVAVTLQQGLTISDVWLKARYMAAKMFVPNVAVTVQKAPRSAELTTQAISLTPDSSAQALRSRLVDLSVPGSPDDAPISATYAIDGIPAGSKNCLLLTETYAFQPIVDPAVDPDLRCEPFGIVTCARFVPEISYTFLPDPDDPVAGRGFHLKAEAQFAFDVDHRGTNSSMLTFDWNWSLIQGAAGPAHVVGGNPLGASTTAVAIRGGEAGGVDNFHQSWKAQVEEPSVFYPGCPECVHMHWRWSSALEGMGLITLGRFPEGGGGKTLIPPGSKQSVGVTVVPGALPILTYSAESSDLSDTFLSHGGWFSPTENLWEHSRVLELSYSNNTKSSLNLILDGRTGGISPQIDLGRSSIESLILSADCPEVIVSAGETLDGVKPIGTYKPSDGKPLGKSGLFTQSGLVGIGQMSEISLPATKAKFVQLRTKDYTPIPLECGIRLNGVPSFSSQ